MKLYFSPVSAYSQKVRVAFYEKGVPFEPVVVDFMDPAAREAFRKVSLIGKVPFLRLEAEDWSIPESSIIIEYLDQRHPDEGPRLVPAHPDRALARKTWAAGDAFTMPDCAAAPALFYARRLVPFDQHENLTACADRLAARPSFPRVIAEAMPRLEKMSAGART